MATRQFDFIVGPETSTLPTVGVPTSDDDLISRGYADLRYVQGGEAVADVTALKAVSSAQRRDGDFYVVKSTNNFYRFDSASALSGDDNFVVQPTVGTGRWIRLTILNRANVFTDTTQSTTSSNGGAVFDGGVGIVKNLNVGGDTILTGNLTVSGTTTTVNSTELDVTDPNILVNNGGNQATANGAVAGVTVNISGGTNARFGYDSSLASRFKVGDQGSESEVLTAGTSQTITGVKTSTVSQIFDNGVGIQLNELTSNGVSSTMVKPADNVTASYTIKLPPAAPTSNGQAITFSTAGVGSFTNVATDALNQFNVKVGDNTNNAVQVDTSSLGDISATSTGGLTIKASKVTSTMILDGTIVDADINAAAAITGTKVQAASASVNGVVNNIAQTFSGDKTFNGVTSVNQGIVTTNAASTDITVLTGTTLAHNNLNIGSGRTYTVNSGGFMAGIGPLIVTGTLIASGTVRYI